jgi:hypothetical protein
MDRVQLGQRVKALPFFVYPTVMDVRSTVSSGKYGRVDDNGAEGALRIAMHVAVATGDGLLVLEAQSCMLTFLRECCRLILGDKMIADLKEDNSQAPPAPAPLPPHDESVRTSLALALQRPYQSPVAALTGINSLLQILADANAALEEARDHVLALREDPGYFANVVAESQEHAAELVEDPLGRPHPDVGKEGCVFLNRIVWRVLEQCHMEVLGWEVVSSLLKVLAKGESVPRGQPGSLLGTQTHCELLLTLRFALDDLLLLPALRRVIDALRADPSQRRRYERTSAMSRAPEPRHGQREAAKDLTFWLIDAGLEHLDNPQSEDKIPDVAVVDILVEIQRMVELSPSMKAELSPFTMRAIAGASLVADVASRLSTSRPHYLSPYQGAGLDWGRFTNVGIDARKRASATNPMYSKAVALFKNASLPNLGLLADPERHESKYPSHKRPTAETVAVMQLAEANLDTFWTRFDGAVEARDRPLGLKFQDIRGSRPLLRTPDWVEPQPQQNQTTAAGAAGATPDNGFDLAAHLQAQASIAGSDTSPQGVAGPKKAKVKTRGQPDASLAGAGDVPGQEGGADDGETAEATPAKPVFNLNKRGMEAVRVLFHHSGEADQPGEMLWPNFLTAMAQTGFAVERVYGSAVCFTPADEALATLSRQSIVIHGPHPGNRVRFAAARRIGSRLTDRYGLDASSFSPRKREETGAVDDE